MYTAHRVSWNDGNNCINSIVLSKAGEDVVDKFKAYWGVYDNVTADYDPLLECFVDENATKPLICFRVIWELPNGTDNRVCLVFTDTIHKIFSCFERGFNCSADQINLILVNNNSVIL